jgi:ABC-type Mn2+/Zn2+ transport system permease subunit
MAVAHSFLRGAAVAFLLFGLMSGTLFVGALVAALLVAFTRRLYELDDPGNGGKARSKRRGPCLSL